MKGLWVVTIEALPSARSDAFAQYGGAFVLVYVTETSKEAALAAAQREISDAGWNCKAVESNTYTTRDDFTGDVAGLERFDQALIDGAVVVFHTYPVEPDKDDGVH
ncbi:hypothetical protein [Thioalkalivibrio sp. XN8]|uniref:hypothetical protein n=1 Tax=Thioalkalivibrio sp. XN8 TaxID=2712863 RepID=UPI0013EBEC5E|nr:hypothetical protein [Thioalkalivibrio sp. XN8]NGP52508.1 hypothetical protein [Thioalkalivibrio sp. XN8]